MLKEAISSIADGRDLTAEEMKTVMTEIMTGEGTDAQKAAFLTELSIKGETIDEISAATTVMHENCEKFVREGDSMEIVGTGGDKSNTINISTGAALVAAAAGVPISKHGNRAASSKCGTADCLEALGVKIDCDTAVSEKALKEAGICFLFAQKYHPAMRFVGKIRKEIGIKTLFNILGPLSNPAHANYMLFGVYSEDLVVPLAHVMAKLGVERAMVVYGTDCMDEISMSAPTKVCEYTGSEFKEYEIVPEDYGFVRCEKSDLVGGEPAENAAILKDILAGAQGPKTDAILMNAGAAIHIYKNVSIEEGIDEARRMIASGAAVRKLEELVNITNA